MERAELAADVRARKNGQIVPVEAADGASYELVASPVQFEEQLSPVRRAPDFSENTEELLQELGLDWPEIIELKAVGAVT